MKSKMLIFIPSMSRAKDVITVRFLPKRWLERTWIVVPESQRRDYYHHNRRVQILEVPDKLKGIHNTRQFIADWCPERYCFQMDDDMTFVQRRDDWSPERPRFAPTFDRFDAQKIGGMLDVMESWLIDEGFSHVGLSARQGNNYVKERIFKDVTRMNNVYGHDLDALDWYGIRWDKLRVMEDFYVTLSLLTRGYPNRLLVDYAWNQKGSGAEGGCSKYRTNEVQTEAALLLQKIFPQYVTVVEKKSKSGWKGMETRTDVRIQWKKAFDQGSKIKG